jgi:hypothetical protein
MDVEYMVYQLKYDSVHGKFKGTVEARDGTPSRMLPMLTRHLRSPRRGCSMPPLLRTPRSVAGCTTTLFYCVAASRAVVVRRCRRDHSREMRAKMTRRQAGGERRGDRGVQRQGPEGHSVGQRRC